jgi:hypothetical protein
MHVSSLGHFQIVLTLSLLGVGLAEDLQLQEAASSYEKEEALLPKFSHISSPECICDDESWLRQCPRLWDHLGSALASTSIADTCQDGVHSDMVPRNCPAAAMHLMVMVGCFLRSR